MKYFPQKKRKSIPKPIPKHFEYTIPKHYP